MKKVILFPAIMVAMLLSTGFSDAQTVKETRNVAGFTGINFGVAGDLYIEIGPQFTVTLEGNKNYIDNIITDKSDQRLNIKLHNWKLGMNEKVTVYVTMPSIEGINVSGSGKAEVRDAIKGENVELNVSGSGKVMIPEIDVKNLECHISGSGTINLMGGGKITDAEIAISGSGNYTGEAAEIESLEVVISGSGKCSCNVTGGLEATISGSGNVIYSGSPKIDAKVSGSGHVRSR